MHTGASLFSILGFIVVIAIYISLIFLQLYFCRQTNKYLGLILPFIFMFFTLLAIVLAFFFMVNTNIIIISLLLPSIIYTITFFLIYLVKTKKKIRKKSIDKIDIENL